MDRIIVTKHAIKRFLERFPYLHDNRSNVRDNIIRLFRDSEKNDSFKHDSLVMEYLYQKHGYYNFSFYVYSSKLLFVCKDDKPNEKIILTCRPPHKFIKTHVKFRKKEEEKDNTIDAMVDAELEGVTRNVVYNFTTNNIEKLAKEVSKRTHEIYNIDLLREKVKRIFDEKKDIEKQKELEKIKE